MLFYECIGDARRESHTVKLTGRKSAGGGARSDFNKSKQARDRKYPSPSSRHAACESQPQNVREKKIIKIKKYRSVILTATSSNGQKIILINSLSCPREFTAPAKLPGDFFPESNMYTMGKYVSPLSPLP